MTKKQIERRLSVLRRIQERLWEKMNSTAREQNALHHLLILGQYEK